ncbi:hypothetical protein FRAAL1643 [Frankia alni ACN14a]|uniref:Uncharacterized protein n=1 Tax=Frankia alni (strain DSM 45986 / CECT 9034 / ACN14a) TaxID=326424 RepID=Q0RQ78_FRAAA|nr:hypothetical protein FRAAL1643 [Frankia alni ACN14a]
MDALRTGPADAPARTIAAPGSGIIVALRLTSRHARCHAFPARVRDPTHREHP